MIYKLRFIPEIEDDVIDGYSWYENKAKGLGEEFLRLFYACANEIPRNPFIYQKAFGEFRRRLVRRFPYAIYYGIEQDEVVILGFFHCARDPRTIEKHLKERIDQESH